MSKALTQDQTGFDAEDLTIRNRVLAYKKALDATPVSVPGRDALLSQFVREVNDLRAQLAQVEKAFGMDDPMAQVLREALASAESRRDTRRIELGEDGEGEEGRARQPVQSVAATPEKQQKHDHDEFLWAMLLFWSWQRSQRSYGLTPQGPKPGLFP